MATGRPNGRPPKPAAAKKAAGSPAADALPQAADPSARTQAEVIPPSLGEDGRKMWAAVWAKASWLTDADTLIVLELCQTYEEKEFVRRAISTGAVERYYMLPNGSAVSHPYIAQLKDLRVLINTHFASIGLDPSSRARLGLMDSLNSNDPLIEMMARRAEREAERRK